MVGSEQAFELKKLHQILSHFNTAMLITYGAGSNFHGRPMAIAQVEENGDLWFLTAADTPKIQEIQTNNQVLVTFQEKDSRFISLSGRAEIVYDSQKINELWHELFKIWFPGGKSDPNLMLIHIKTEQGEYWDNGGVNRVAFVMEALRAYASGQRMPITDMEENSSRHGRL